LVERYSLAVSSNVVVLSYPILSLLIYGGKIAVSIEMTLETPLKMKKRVKWMRR